MRRLHVVVAGMSAAGILATTAADARCLASRRPIEGQLSVMRVMNDAGKPLKGYQIALANPSCADAKDLDGAPVRLNGVRTVQILPSSAAGEQKLDSLIGERIVIAGYLDAADPQRHTGDAVLANAWLVDVSSLAPGAGNGGSPAIRADDGLADGTEQAVAAPPPAKVTGHTDIAIAAPDGSETPYVAPPPPDAERTALETRLSAFVTNFYLSGKNASPELLRALYAPRVAYFGHSVGVDHVVSDKLGYYGRWPVRAYELQPGSLDIRPLRGDGAVYEITFVYHFDVTSAKDHRAGLGYARLQVDLTDGHGKIIKESGKVVGRG